MKNNNKKNNNIVTKMEKEIESLKKQIKHTNIRNIRNYAMRLLIKSGIVLDYALPFILSAIIIANIQASKDNSPFILDEITENTKIETIDTSSGIHIENKSYDYKYKKELIEHSTGWIINDRGLYERTITSYRISDKIDLSDPKSILSMTKEEIDSFLEITDVETIQKNILEEEDSIYNYEGIIIINHSESKDDLIIRKQTNDENFWDGFLYIILVFIVGFGLTGIKNIFLKTSIKDSLKKCESSFQKISKDDLNYIKKMLLLKEENLRLLTEEDLNQFEKDNYSYRLRKDKR